MSAVSGAQHTRDAHSVEEQLLAAHTCKLVPGTCIEQRLMPAACAQRRLQQEHERWRQYLGPSTCRPLIACDQEQMFVSTWALRTAKYCVCAEAAAGRARAVSAVPRTQHT